MILIIAYHKEILHFCIVYVCFFSVYSIMHVFNARMYLHTYRTKFIGRVCYSNFYANAQHYHYHITNIISISNDSYMNHKAVQIKNNLSRDAVDIRGNGFIKWFFFYSVPNRVCCLIQTQFHRFYWIFLTCLWLYCLAYILGFFGIVLFGG